MKLLSVISLTVLLVASASQAAKHNYKVKGGICTDGSKFHEVESIPVGTIFPMESESLKEAVKSSKGEFFFLRGDERNVFIKFKSGYDYEYASGQAPCPREAWSLISLERVD